MIYLIFSILIISQVICYYLIFNKIKPIIKPSEPVGILLKPIPNSIEYKDVDPKYTLIKDVLESIKLENWDVVVKPDSMSYHSRCYDITTSSHSKDISIRSKIRISDISDGTPFLSIFVISTSGSSISIKSDDSISNEILEFLWEYIIKYHDDENNYSIGRYREAIDQISSKLKALGRSRKLNQIL